MYLGKIALCLIFQNDTSSTMGFIADNQVNLTTVEVDSLFYDVDTLIG